MAGSTFRCWWTATSGADVAYVGTEFVLNQNAVNSMLRTQRGTVGKDMLRRAKNVQKAAKDAAPVGKVGGGRMKRAITAKLVTETGPVPVGLVTNNVHYAMWVHRGTGIYDGKGFIRPKSKRYMVFSTAYGNYNIPSHGGFYYADYIKGQKANPFMVRVLPVALR